jgi:N-hydroxyarylamine O-acetyltransferase
VDRGRVAAVPRNIRHVEAGDAIDVGRYLARIGLDPQTGPPSLELLTELQLSHLVHVPFENLHVYHRRGPRTDVAWSYPKIVEQGRGGWCFELNGSFAALLRAIGFSVDSVSCRVFEDGVWGPDLDHLAEVVHLDGARWFVDVGFGDCPLHPLLLEDGRVPAIPRAVEVAVHDDHALLSELMPRDDGEAQWDPQLRVSFAPRTLDEFTSRSDYLQTHPGLSWQEKPFATRALDGTGSRRTLRMSGLLRHRIGTGDWDDVVVTPENWSDTLYEHFGLVDTLQR